MKLPAGNYTGLIILVTSSLLLPAACIPQPSTGHPTTDLTAILRTLSNTFLLATELRIPNTRAGRRTARPPSCDLGLRNVWFPESSQRFQPQEPTCIAILSTWSSFFLGAGPLLFCLLLGSRSRLYDPHGEVKAPHSKQHEVQMRASLNSVLVLAP